MRAGRSAWGWAAAAGLAGCVAVADTPDPGTMGGHELVRVRHAIAADLVELEDGRRIHYAGVEAPPAGDPLASEARAANARLVEGTEVRLMPVAGGPGEWAYVAVPSQTGRLNVLVQFELAALGLVRPADRPDVRHDAYFDEIVSRAERARRAGLGMWRAGSGPP